jgi:hypothetical protein
MAQEICRKLRYPFGHKEPVIIRETFENGFFETHWRHLPVGTVKLHRMCYFKIVRKDNFLIEHLRKAFNPITAPNPKRPAMEIIH